MSESRPTKKYRAIAADLEDLITSGRIGPSEQLPSVAELVNQYGVSRPTARDAYRLLVKRGHVVNAEGKYFVRQVTRRRWDLARRGRYVSPVRELLQHPGLQQEISVDVLDENACVQDLRLAEWFGTERGDYVRRSTLYAADTARLLVVSHLPLSRVDGPLLRPQPLDDDVVTYLLQQSNAALDSFGNSVAVRIVDEREATMLETQEGTLVVEVVRPIRIRPGGEILVLDCLLVPADGARLLFEGVGGGESDQ